MQPRRIDFRNNVLGSVPVFGRFGLKLIDAAPKVSIDGRKSGSEFRDLPEVGVFLQVPLLENVVLYRTGDVDDMDRFQVACCQLALHKIDISQHPKRGAVEDDEVWLLCSEDVGGGNILVVNHLHTDLAGEFQFRLFEPVVVDVSEFLTLHSEGKLLEELQFPF